MRNRQRRIAKLVFGLIIAGCIIYLVYPDNAIIMSKEEVDAMISEDTLHEANPSGQACVHPKLQLWHPSLKEYFQPEQPVQCSNEQNWVHIKNGTFKISEEAEKKHNKIICDYTPILWDGDFGVKAGEKVPYKLDGTRLNSDFFEVFCKASDGKTYSNVHSGVAFNREAHARASVTSIPQNTMGVNMLMYGIDSVSRMTYMRNLPKTHDYFVNELGGVVMEGYNIVGDGTPQALLPILTGKTEQELPDARRGQPEARPVDDHPWIWKEFKKAGYITQWGEDATSIGTFQYRMLGFEKQPTDHYMRTYHLKAEKQYNQNDNYCLGSVPRHVNMMNYMLDFTRMYTKQPKWSFLFHNEFSHDHISKLSVSDNDMKQFLEDLKKENHLDNTILILMADHGARFKLFRDSVQGKYEERMPYIGVLLPAWFKTKYPDAVKNLRTNAHRLTTPFDIHKTFLHMLDYKGSKVGNVKERGISLFDEVPKERRCSDADIETHWCACLNWKSVSQNDSNISASADALISIINKVTEPERALCEVLSVKNITSANLYLPKRSMLAFKRSKDADGFIPDFRHDTGASEVFYQITVVTVPGNAKFEATVKHVHKSKDMHVSLRDVSRINRYGDQPHCVASHLPHLRKYCYCRKQL